MAGGEGSRLRPLTCDRPKPMVPVGNRPIMDYALDLLKKHRITEIGVTLQYLPEAIMEHFGDGAECGVNLSYFIEEVPLGTAGSVKNAEDFLDEPFIVVSGDALTDFDLSRAIQYHREKKALVTIVLTTVQTPLEYGVVITGEDGSIRRFLEKPSWGEVFSDRVNTGIYILEPEVLRLVPAGRMFDFSKDLFPMLLAEGAPMYGCVLSGYWCDIGNLQQYRQAHYDLLAGRVAVELPPAEQDIRTGAGTSISPTARLEGPVIIGEQCVIGPEAVIEPFTVIGDRVVVEEGVTIKRSVVWDNTFVGRKAALRGALVGKQVIVGSNASVYEGAVIGDGTSLGERAVVKPEVKVWPHKAVEKGVTLHTSMVWGTCTGKNLFGRDGVPGLANLEMTPEFAARLGAAYGASLSQGSRVVVSSDGSASCRMVKSALMAGVQSAGVSCLDLGDLVTPVHRFILPALEARGGLHVKRDARNRDKIWVHFLDPAGMDITPGSARKVENLFWREDFRRVKEAEVGASEALPHVADAYRDNLLAQVDVEAIQARGFRLVVDRHAPFLAEMVGLLWDTLQCRVEDFLVPIGETEPNFDAMTEMLSHLAREVVQRESDLGVMMDHNAERLILVDDQGRIIQEPFLTILISKIIFEANGGGVMAVPVTASRAVEQVAEKCGGRIIRTKTAPYAMMEAAVREEVRGSQGKYAQLGMQFDAIQAVVKLLDFLAARGLFLSELVSSLPEAYTGSQDTECPWEAKGKVMRTLIESEPPDQVELLDGIKVHRDNGWALVLPDADEPLYRVFSEGFSQEIADELTNVYVEKIKNIIEGKEK